MNFVSMDQQMCFKIVSLFLVQLTIVMAKTTEQLDFLNNNCQIQIHPIFSLTLDQMEKRRIMIPEWLIPTMFDTFSSSLFEIEEDYLENNLQMFF